MFAYQKLILLPLKLCLVLCLTFGQQAWAQNVRAQSGIVAATSGYVRVVSNDIGRVAETGQKIYLDDIVETGEGGKMQIMLMDRTTITIGPNTSIVIDEFVFDPGVERTLSAKVLKGTFKLASPSLFNSGKQSREIKLPNAVVAIRGTEIIGSIAENVQNVVLLDGAITVANNDFIQDIDRPNFGVSITETGEITPPQFFSSQDLGTLLEQLDGSAEAPSSGDVEAESAAENTEEDATSEDGEAEDAQQAEGQPEDEPAQAAQGVANTNEADQEAPPSFLTRAEEGPAPTEAEVTAAAEAVADGSADIEDLQVLSRAGPSNVATISRVLGVNVDAETGKIDPGINPEASAEAEANFISNVEGILSRNGIAPPEGENFSFESPELSLNIEEGGGLAQVEAFSSFLNTRDIGGGEISSIDKPNFDTPSFNTPSFEPLTFEAPQFETSFNTSAFFAPQIEFNPVAFESLNDFTVLEPDTDFFFETPRLSLTSFSFNPFFTNEENNDGDETTQRETILLDTLLNPETEDTTDTNIDNIVTEALEEVINDIAEDTSSVLPDGTFMPERSSYRSWNGSEWSTIAQNFNSGIVRFEHNNVTAGFHSGSYCTDCSAEVSNTLTIDFTSMEYNFQGGGIFTKPGYEDVTFGATTPDIPLNYWELSSGTIYRLPNERELESTYDNPEVYTLTSSSDPSVTVDATIDLDFIYDTIMSDNSDLGSNIGVYGRMTVEYTETGSSEVTFRTEEEAMRPVQE